MQAFPHHYRVIARGGVDGYVTLTSDGLEALETAPPVEFGGSGDAWSPETLLVGAVADCLVLSFRAVARASRLDWESLEVDVDGMLDKTADGVRFSALTLYPRLTLPDSGDEAQARRCLDKAKRNCLITNSLNAEIAMEPRISLEPTEA